MNEQIEYLKRRERAALLNRQGNRLETLIRGSSLDEIAGVSGNDIPRRLGHAVVAHLEAREALS